MIERRESGTKCQVFKAVRPVDRHQKQCLHLCAAIAAGPIAAAFVPSAVRSKEVHMAGKAMRERHPRHD